MPRFAVILPAAGRSSRFKDKEKKPYVNLDGRAVWLRTAELFITRDDVALTLLVIDKDDEEMVRRRYTPNMAFMNIKLVHGGKERFESVANALAHLPAYRGAPYYQPRPPSRRHRALRQLRVALTLAAVIAAIVFTWILLSHGPNWP